MMIEALKKLEVSIILIPHNNPERFQTRLERDLLPTIEAHPTWKFQIVIADNSEASHRPSYDLLRESALEYQVIWTGSNMMYGPAMNLAVALCDHPYIIYACTNHGRMFDTSWIDDLIEPLIEDSNVAMTGSVCPSGHPTVFGFPAHLPSIHIQGGLFGSKTKVLSAYPYTHDSRWIHGGSDVYQSFQFLNAGMQLRDIPTIKSVWCGKLDSPEQWKYVHDYSE
jgi:hypothetical protein